MLCDGEILTRTKAFLFSAVFTPIAISGFEGAGPIGPVLNGMLQFPTVVFVMYLFVLTFQVLAFIPILDYRWMRLWGIFAVMFHAGVGVFMNIWFSSTQTAAVFFLVICEYALEETGPESQEFPTRSGQNR